MTTPEPSTLPLEVRQTLQGIRGIEVDVAKIQTELHKEIFALEAKYEAKVAALYDRRRQIISGAAGVTAAEFTAGEEESKKEDDEYTPLPTLSGATAAASKIADYWVQTLESHPGFETLITAEDRPALAYLSDIRVTYAVDKLSYTIEFVFDENPYFTNASLKKTWFFKGEVGFFGHLIPSHVFAEKVNWKDGQNLIEQGKKRVEDAKAASSATAGSKVKKVIKKGDDEILDDGSSFFSYFDPPANTTVPEEQVPKKPKDEDDDEDDEDYDDRPNLLEMEFDLGDALRGRILAHSVDYFTGEAKDYEEEDGIFSWTDDEDEDED